MKNTVHRHEPPVVGAPLQILVDDGEVLVVDKPASIPVHPCGRFRHNTVIFILGKERGLSELHTVHRLDRLTSGVLLFARTLESSKRLDQLVRDRQVGLVSTCRCHIKGSAVINKPKMLRAFTLSPSLRRSTCAECKESFRRVS